MLVRVRKTLLIHHKAKIGYHHICCRKRNIKKIPNRVTTHNYLSANGSNRVKFDAITHHPRHKIFYIFNVMFNYTIYFSYIEFFELVTNTHWHKQRFVFIYIEIRLPKLHRLTIVWSVLSQYNVWSRSMHISLVYVCVDSIKTAWNNKTFR